MKIALVSPYPPSKGTLNEYAFHLVQSLVKKDVVEKITILSDYLPEGLSYDEMLVSDKMEIIPCWKFNSIKNPYTIAKAIKNSNSNLVFFNIQFLSFGDNKVAAALGLTLPIISKLIRVPSLVLIHNILETVDLDSAGITSNKLMQKMYQSIGNVLTRIILSANAITVTIPKYVEILEKKYKTNKVALIPHGSFESGFKPEAETHDHFAIMTFGKFGTYKKIDNMIESIVQARKELGRDIKIVIGGSDNPNALGYLQSVQEKYAAIPNIHFTGYVEEEDVPRLFDEATAVLFDYTSTTGSSGVLHQAGCFRRAAIIPQIGDLKELVEEEGYRGAYFEPNDVPSMTKAVVQVLSDKNYRDELAWQNYTAAMALPMSDIADWYILNFRKITS